MNKPPKSHPIKLFCSSFKPRLL